MGDLTRRRFLQLGSGATVGGAAVASMPFGMQSALAAPSAPGTTLNDIEHVVIFMQENRAFDHYFGTLSGVAGFADPEAAVHPLTGRSVFDQLDPDVVDNPSGHVLPFHFDTARVKAQCEKDPPHDWATLHVANGGGNNDLWMVAHRAGVIGNELVAGGAEPLDPLHAPLTMGYFTRADLPFHYALADAFTICDRYFCSVIGPTNPNRLMMMTGTIDPEGTHGGAETANALTGFSWTTYPERLQAAGIDWWVYRERDDFGDNMLDHFVQYQDTRTELYRRGRSVIADGMLTSKLRDDVVSGNLPQVSWIVNPYRYTEHPTALPAAGAWYMHRVVEALTADPKVWAKTALIITYDENGGFFDHVAPPTAPLGTPGEYVEPGGLLAEPTSLGIPGPIGLGTRVPTMVISPFSRGGLVCSETFDHTSLLQFLERRFGVEAPNISAWRRETCGDLTSAFNFAAAPDVSVPSFPDTDGLLEEAEGQCAFLGRATVPAEQFVPAQEPGLRPRPSGIVAAAATPRPVTIKPVTAPGSIPATGGDARLGAVGAAVLAGAVAVRAVRERRVGGDEPTR